MASTSRQLARDVARLVAVAALVLFAGAAQAQELSFMEGGGVRLGERFVLHPRFELSTGYQPNVFSQDDTDANFTGAGIARFTVGALLQTRTAERGTFADEIETEPAKPALALRADAQLYWNQFLASSSAVTGQSDLGAQVLGELQLNPQGQLSLVIRESFQRLVRPGQSGRDFDHDFNDLGAGVTWKPGGGALSFGANYNWIIDFFEDEALSVVNRMSHRFALGGKWQWLPKTDITLDTSLTIVDPSDDTFRPSSLPLRIWLGVSTLLTPTFGVIVKGGYGNSFYSTGPNFSSYLAHVEARYSPLPTLQVAGGYIHDFADAYIGSFYVDHAFFARFAMQLATRWQLQAKGELRLRSYEGIVDQMGIDYCGNAACENTRFDVVSRFDAGVEYQMRPWLFLGASYSLNAIATDFFIRTSSAADSAGYVWHELIVKASARF